MSTLYFPLISSEWPHLKPPTTC
uniref:Uncharacterized protein n=1 Tax=Arundo donax TaxID=35708 RepID=A0A0A9CRI1_ARUDO